MQRIFEYSIAVVFGIIIGGLIFWIASPPRGNPIDLQPLPEKADFVVYITGAVQNPGVYTLLNSSRLADVVEMAGGMSPDANREAINMAAPLQDGAKIYIPRVGENIETVSRSSGIADTIECPIPESNSRSPETKVNINTAGVEELETLPGIGPDKAQGIIDYREENGSFTSIEEIKKVPGIGSKTFDDIKDMINN